MRARANMRTTRSKTAPTSVAYTNKNSRRNYFIGNATRACNIPLSNFFVHPEGRTRSRNGSLSKIPPEGRNNEIHHSSVLHSSGLSLVRTAGNHPRSGKMACSRHRGKAANPWNFLSLSLHTIIKSLGRVQGKLTIAQTDRLKPEWRRSRTLNTPTAIRLATLGLRSWPITFSTRSSRDLAQIAFTIHQRHFARQSTVYNPGL